jgi:hypothetical protein
MPALLEDHGLPLVQLKERRRDLIVALMGRPGLLSEQQIAEIASIQSAIAAFEIAVTQKSRPAFARSQRQENLWDAGSIWRADSWSKRGSVSARQTIILKLE